MRLIKLRRDPFLMEFQHMGVPDLHQGFFHLMRGGIEIFTSHIDQIHAPIREIAMEPSLKAHTASGEKITACRSKRDGTEASSSSRMRSSGFNRRVIPIFTTPSPKAPMVETL